MTITLYQTGEGWHAKAKPGAIEFDTGPHPSPDKAIETIERLTGRAATKQKWIEPPAKVAGQLRLF